METTTKRQVSPTFPKKEWAEDWMQKLIAADSGWFRNDGTGGHLVAAPWDKWTVEEVQYGWGVFVTESR